MLLEAYLAVQAMAMASKAGIRHFDWFNQQYLDGNKEGYTTPAVFVEFVPVETQSLTNKVQKSPLNFRLHLVTERTRHTQHGTSKQRLALDHLEKAEEIFKAFAGKGYVKPADEEGAEPKRILNSCSRTNITPDHSMNELIVTVQEFKTVAFDYSAVPEKLKVKPRQSIAPEMA